VQGLNLSLSPSSDAAQGEIMGVSPMKKEKSLCKKENE
jgi:hypothetical protein